jgi:DNA polymerase-3 subunit gamma/tau
MAYQVLARKWRPQKFSDLKGQDHVVKALVGAVKNKKIAHAFLLTGTRGVGKTSIARILAKAINCDFLKENGDPCLECASCKSLSDVNSMDYLEIDGASHNGVEHIRQIVDNTQYLPLTSRYKIYVIDEVHMLSNSAFNALLKTLEEPPAHVIFIFATTNPEDIPETVLSRCQRFDLRHIGKENISQVISKIIEAEKIKFESTEAFDVLVEAGEGSLRDALSLLEQLLVMSQNGIIKTQDVYFSLGLVSRSTVSTILENILNSEREKLIQNYQTCTQSSFDLKKFCIQLSRALFKKIESLPRESYQDLAEMMWIYEVFSKDFDWALKSFDPQLSVRIVLEKITLRREFLSHHVSNATAESPESSQEKKKILQIDETQWRAFVEDLKNTQPTSSASLEHGNLLSYREGEFLVGYTAQDVSLFEYLEEKETTAKILQKLKEYFSLDTTPKIVFKQLSSDWIEENKFKSIYDLEIIDLEKIRDEKIKKISDNPYVVKMQTLFNSKIDKIVLDEDK